MKFYKNLYIGETIKNPNKVKWKLKRNAALQNIYVIAIAKGKDQLEIYHCAFLKQKVYKLYPPYIIGICTSYDEAIDMVVNITKETVSVTGGADIKKYLFEQAKTG